MDAVLGLDIGTTSTVGVLVALPDRMLAQASRPVTLHSPQPGWAEEDPAQWWTNVCEIVPELLALSGLAAADIKAVGVAGMLPAVVALGQDGSVLHPSIQQSDGRCGQEVEELRAELDEDAFLARSGNGINQQLVTAKLRWLRRNRPEIFGSISTVMGSYDYVNFRLTGERAVERNWALEAGFVDITRHALDDGLIALAGVERAAIPRLIGSHEILGRVDGAGAQATGLALGTPVVGGAADMVASALGAGVTQAGDVLLKFGGAVDILTATDTPAPDRRLFLDYHLVPGLFMPNGCMSTGGSVLNWFVRTFARAEAADAAERGLTAHQHLDALAAGRPAGSDGLLVLPYLLGEKTPIHDTGARGVFDGLTLSHDIGHLWRALLEAYAYALRHHADVLRDLGHEPRRFVASDGGAASAVWMGIVADVLGAPVERLSGHPGSCLGAAWTAAMGTGLAERWSDIERFVSFETPILPAPSNAAVYDEGYRRFRDLYQRLRGPRG